MEYKDYTTTLDNVNAQLDLNGVAVIPNILTDVECVEMRDRIWAELKHVTQDRFDVNDTSTWKEFFNFYPLHSMLLQHFSLGHMQPIWDIRSHPNVCGVFEKIWGVNKKDLLVSFDGLSVHLPPEKTRKGWYLNNNWFHTDQSFAKKGKRCIQGFVNLYPVNEKDATLAVLEGSHRFHESFNDQFKPECSGDWYKLDESNDELRFYLDKGCRKYAVRASQGSIVLWDSRTIHQGKEPEKSREIANFRMISYICMLPRSMATEKALIKKRKAFDDLRVTNHWPNAPKLFPKTPRTYGGDLPEFNPIHKPELTDVGKKLAGF
jgi:hypothetical protein